MSKRHGTREQKRLAKKKAKREVRRRQLDLRHSPDPAVQFKDADRWPVVSALVPQGIWSTGVGSLLIARRAPNGRLAWAMFLVDVFCLGVKDTIWKIATQREFDAVRKYFERAGRLRQVRPEYFAKLVYQAVDYAQSLGFAPHRDFQQAQLLLGGIDPSQCGDEFQFGRDGLPFYVCGPYESPERARAIAERVREIGGDYFMPIEPSELLIDFESLNEAFDDDEVDEAEDAYFDDIIDCSDDTIGEEFPKVYPVRQNLNR